MRKYVPSCGGITSEEKSNDVYYYLAIRSYILKLRAKTTSVSIKNMKECVYPKVVIVCGYAPDDVFGPLKDHGAEIWRFDSEIAKAFGAGGGD